MGVTRMEKDGGRWSMKEGCKGREERIAKVEQTNLPFLSDNKSQY